MKTLLLYIKRCVFFLLVAELYIIFSDIWGIKLSLYNQNNGKFCFCLCFHLFKNHNTYSRKHFLKKNLNHYINSDLGTEQHHHLAAYVNKYASYKCKRRICNTLSKFINFHLELPEPYKYILKQNILLHAIKVSGCLSEIFIGCGFIFS